MGESHGALTQLQAWLAQARLSEDARLPPERELCALLGVSRTDVRKALAALEADGLLWRHVGKGTFLGARPAREAAGVAGVADATNPAEVMRARLLLEPVLAGEAALHATSAAIAELRACLEGARRAETWRSYESWDNRLHHAIAEAGGNTVMLALFDTLNAVRRAVVWGRLRPGPARPPHDHHSFVDHDAIVAAIADRDMAGAALAMRRHLAQVQDNLMVRRAAAE